MRIPYEYVFALCRIEPEDKWARIGDRLSFTDAFGVNGDFIEHRLFVVMLGLVDTVRYFSSCRGDVALGKCSSYIEAVRSLSRRHGCVA